MNTPEIEMFPEVGVNPKPAWVLSHLERIEGLEKVRAVRVPAADPDQITLDFEAAEFYREYDEHVAHNVAADHHNWTPESIALASTLSWAGIQKDEWQSMHQYQRNYVLAAYEARAGQPMPRFYDDTKERLRLAREFADQLSADWAANRPASCATYDPVVAGAISLMLGRRVEAQKPPVKA